MNNILLRLLVHGLVGLGMCHAALAETTATIVWFTEQEPGVDPYRVRYLVTPEYMRSDDGQAGNDFLLYDRRQRMIYNVVSGSRTVLEIDGNGEAPRRPGTLSFAVQRHAAPSAPMIDGNQPLEVRLVAADQSCRSALVVADFLEPVRAALREYSRALAVQQVRTLDHTPVELQTPCFLARYVYAGDFALAEGMILADWDQRGQRRELTSYRTDVPVADTLFALPADFRRIEPGAN